MSDEEANRGRAEIRERLAVAETKLNVVLDDNKIIRSTLHGIHGEMQKYVLKEGEHANLLQTLVERTSHLPDILAAIAEFSALKPAIEQLKIKAETRSTIWNFWTILFGGLLAAATLTTQVVLAVQAIRGRV